MTWFSYGNTDRGYELRGLDDREYSVREAVERYINDKAPFGLLSRDLPYVAHFPMDERGPWLVLAKPAGSGTIYGQIIYPRDYAQAEFSPYRFAAADPPPGRRIVDGIGEALSYRGDPLPVDSPAYLPCAARLFEGLSGDARREAHQSIAVGGRRFGRVFFAYREGSGDAALRRFGDAPDRVAETDGTPDRAGGAARRARREAPAKGEVPVVDRETMTAVVSEALREALERYRLERSDAIAGAVAERAAEALREEAKAAAALMEQAIRRHRARESELSGSEIVRTVAERVAKASEARFEALGRSLSAAVEKRLLDAAARGSAAAAKSIADAAAESIDKRMAVRVEQLADIVNETPRTRIGHGKTVRGAPAEDVVGGEQAPGGAGRLRRQWPWAAIAVAVALSAVNLAVAVDISNRLAQAAQKEDIASLAGNVEPLEPELAAVAAGVSALRGEVASASDISALSDELGELAGALSALRGEVAPASELAAVAADVSALREDGARAEAVAALAGELGKIVWALSALRRQIERIAAGVSALRAEGASAANGGATYGSYGAAQEGNGP